MVEPELVKKYEEEYRKEKEEKEKIEMDELAKKIAKKKVENEGKSFFQKVKDAIAVQREIVRKRKEEKRRG